MRFVESTISTVHWHQKVRGNVRQMRSATGRLVSGIKNTKVSQYTIRFWAKYHGHKREVRIAKVWGSTGRGWRPGSSCNRIGVVQSRPKWCEKTICVLPVTKYRELNNNLWYIITQCKSHYTIFSNVLITIWSFFINN